MSDQYARSSIETLKVLDSDDVDYSSLIQEVITRLRNIGPVRDLLDTQWFSHLTIPQRIGGFDPDGLQLLPLELQEQVWMAMATDHQTHVRKMAIRHTECPVAVMQILARDPDAEIRTAVAEHAGCPGDILMQLSLSRNRHIQLAVLSNRNCPAEVIRRFSKSHEQGTCRAISSNPSCPEDVLRKMTRRLDLFVLITLSKNPSCTPVVFESLADEDDYRIRAAVAGNPACPASIRESLIKILAQGSEHAKQELASLECCPPEILKLFARNPDPEIRAAVAYNPACPPSVLEKLSKDRCSEVRDYLAQNPAVPIKVLEQLACDKSLRVRIMVQKNSRCPPMLRNSILEAMAQDSDPEWRGVVARTSDCPARLLELLAKDGNEFVRSYVARNESTPLHIIETLSNDPSVEVRRFVGNLERRRFDSERKQVCVTATAPDELVKLSTSGFYSIRLNALHNSNYPSELRGITLAKLVEEMSAWFIQPAISKPEKPFDVDDFMIPLRALGFVYEGHDSRVILKAAKSKIWIKRVGAVFSPNIRSTLLRMLLDDSVEIVKQLAAKRLKEMN